MSDSTTTRKIPLKYMDCLRISCMFMVFFHHVWGFLPFSLPDIGGRGVELFFMMSGFLLTYNHLDDYSAISSGECSRLVICKTLRLFDIRGAIIRILKYYPLHIITMIIMIPVSIIENENTVHLISRLLTNILLIQSWVPDESYYWAFNGVSWFLSTIILSYALFPVFLSFIRRMKKKQTEYISLVFLFIFLCIVHTATEKYNGNVGYFFYIFPPYRALVFFIGCILGSVFLKETTKINEKRKWNCSLLIASVLFICAMILCDKIWNATLFIPVEAALIYSVAAASYNRTTHLSICIIKKLGSVSFEFYLIHHVVVVYWSKYCWGLFGNRNPHWIEHVLYMLILSLGISFVAHKAAEMIRNRESLDVKMRKAFSLLDEEKKKMILQEIEKKCVGRD